MPTIEDIHEIRDRYVTVLYSKVREEQGTDLAYINDTFNVPEIKKPHQIYRSGIGDRIVNAPAEHIVTSNPQVFFHPRRPTKTAQASALKLSELVNQHWLPILQRQNPNIFKSFVKDLLGRGEAFFRVGHVPDWASIPVRFSVPDPMVVYSSPEEDENGIPVKVIVYYQIAQYQELIPKYEQLKDLTPDQEGRVNWLEYHEAQNRYVEVEEVVLTKNGVQENVYGFTPFVRRYSGFGRRSPDGELAHLIVSDIKRSRDLIREECATRSNIASIEYLFAHRAFTLIGKDLPSTDNINENLSFGAYDLNTIDADPRALEMKELLITPSAETYKHHADLIGELNQRHPFILAGFPWGTSGRQQDMTEVAAMRRYDPVVENTENAFATALQLALKICKLPGYRPKGVTLNDLETEYDIEVKLKADDPIEEDRRITLGERLWAKGQGSISLGTLHTDYMYMTKDESNKEIAKILADQVTIYNPDIASVLGMVAAEESGMEQWLQKARERRLLLEQGGGLSETPARTTQERTQGEVETPRGEEQALPRGGRRSPERYTRRE